MSNCTSCKRVFEWDLNTYMTGNKLDIKTNEIWFPVKIMTRVR
jgi:hypothetical protein